MALLLEIVIVITALLALYWVFYGQRRHDEMMNPPRKTELKAILFDLDGVLIDSLDRQHQVFNEIRENFKLKPITKEEFKKKLWGFSLETNGKNYFKDHDIKEVRKQYNASVDKNLEKSRAFPNVEKVLKKIKENKLKIGLVTNTVRQRTIKDLELNKIKEYFDVIVTADDVENPKPYPDPVLKACEELNVMPDEVIFVGDTKNDYKAGKSAGCFVVGIDMHADLIISKIEDMLELIKDKEN